MEERKKKEKEMRDERRMFSYIEAKQTGPARAKARALKVKAEAKHAAMVEARAVHTLQKSIVTPLAAHKATHKAMHKATHKATHEVKHDAKHEDKHEVKQVGPLVRTKTIH